MLNPDKKTVIFPCDGILEGCLDMVFETGDYALRLEGLESRLVVIPEGGAVEFLGIFEKFVEEYLILKEATLNA